MHYKNCRQPFALYILIPTFPLPPHERCRWEVFLMLWILKLVSPAALEHYYGAEVPNCGTKLLPIILFQMMSIMENLTDKIISQSLLLSSLVTVGVYLCHLKLTCTPFRSSSPGNGKNFHCCFPQLFSTFK